MVVLKFIGVVFAIILAVLAIFGLVSMVFVAILYEEINNTTSE